MAIQFTALQNFWCEEAKSEYCPDLVYTANEGTIIHGMLELLVKEGKVQILSHNAKPRAQMRGQAQVIDEPPSLPKKGFFTKVKEVFSWL